MEDIQQSEWLFYLPITLSYTVACLFAYYSYAKIGLLAKTELPPPARPGIELMLALVAIVCILLVGRLYTAGYLLSSEYKSATWIINNLIIYSPIFVILLIRKQSLATVWLSPEKWYWKIGIGIVLGFVTVLLFLLLRSELHRLPTVWAKAFSAQGLSNFVAVFLEGVALAFLFVRLKWASNLRLALTLPALLFALAHVPNMLAEGDPWWHILLMSSATGFISVFVLYTCHRTNDIIWLGMVHYFLDAAINAY